MLVEIRKAGFRNKGAELMQKAVVQKIQQELPEAKIAMAPSLSSATFEDRSRMGFYQKAWLWKYGFQWGNLAGLLPRKISKMYGIVLDKDIDVVLDASGFSYSDQWGISSSQELANASKRWMSQKKKTVLLPQAFGPFSSRSIREAIKIAMDNVGLVYAREEASYSYLTDIVGKRENIKIAPDFTNLIDGVLPEDFDVKKNRFCIVPNYRMIDKTSRGERDAYIPFLIACVKRLKEKDAKPFFLIHEGENDALLANEVVKAVGSSIPIIKEVDPLKIKGILGACDGSIGSRFHGLVSAMSQGVPSLATGWSHKYEMLFNDYGFDEGIVDLSKKGEHLEKLDLILSDISDGKIRSQLSKRSTALKALSANMWAEVFSYIKS